MVSAKPGLFDQIDNATVYAAFGAVGATGAAWITGASPKQAAAVAAIPSLAAAFLHSDKRELAFRAAYMTAACFVCSKLVGFHQISWRGGVAVAAGAVGGTYLWSHSPTKKLVRYRDSGQLPALVYPVIGLIIGVVRPDWFKPLHGAVLLGLRAAYWEIRYQHWILSQKSENKRHWWSHVTRPILAMVFPLIPWQATGLGFPTTYSQFIIACGAASVIFGFSGIVHNTWYSESPSKE